MAERVRIQKAIAAAGVMSRRAAEEAISEGRVTVEGRTAILGDRVDPDSERLEIDGVPVTIDPETETHLVYKPVGVISTAHDPQGRPTVVDLVGSSRRLFPVGRLDADSEGLILVSNDGELTNRVTHPRYGITKRYQVIVDGRPGPADMRRLVEGVSLEDGVAKAVDARLIDSSGKRSMISMTMGEGRNREIRRMLASLGYEVVSLVRVAIGPITDSKLVPGHSRRLSGAEIDLLLRSGGSK